MLPPTFPKKPPYVRIVNKNPGLVVDKFYLPLRSPTDPNSYILNEKLTQCRTWDQNKSIVNIIIESHNMLRQTFPFNQPSQQQGGGGNQFNQGFNQGWNQGQNSNNNQYGGTSGTNYGFVNPNTYNNNNYGNNPRPPIPFSTANVNQSIANGQKFVGNSKKIIEKLKTQHLKCVDRNQHLETIKQSLESEE